MIKIFKYLILSVIGLFLLGILLLYKKDIPLEKLKEKYAVSPSQFIEIEGMNVHFRDEGNVQDSIPLILLHGTGASLHTWEDWVTQLRGAHRVICLDLPAYGLTGPFPNRDYSIEHYIAFLHSFFEKKGIKQCYLGGNSFGGELAWEYTLAHPDKINKLVLVDAAGYPIKSKKMPVAFSMARTPVLNKILTIISSRSIVESSVKNVYADASKVSDALVDRYSDLSLREGNRQAFVDRILMQTFDGNKNITKLKSLNQPVLILWGEKDMLIPVENAHYFHNDLPNDTLIIFKNLGHVPMEEAGTQTVQTVSQFLK